MPATSPASVESFDRHVFILGRWQEYEGEARANLLRIIGIGAFYIVELLNYYGLQLGFIEIPQLADRQFHEAVTALAVVWTMISCHDPIVRDRLKLYLTRLRDVRVTLTGDDLKRMGLPPGPRYKKILAGLLDAKLDGAVITKEDEIAYVQRAIGRK